MIVIVHIHNNSLSSIKSVCSIESGLNKVRGEAESKLNRELTDEEVDSLNDFHEVYSEKDLDNTWCISLGIVD